MNTTPEQCRNEKHFKVRWEYSVCHPEMGLPVT